MVSSGQNLSTPALPSSPSWWRIYPVSWPDLQEGFQAAGRWLSSLRPSEPWLSVISARWQRWMAPNKGPLNVDLQAKKGANLLVVIFLALGSLGL